MKLLKCLLFLLLSSNFCLIAQSEYSGVVQDLNTNKKMPYVNIGIVDKGIGTVTDENGKFSLIFDFRRITKTDTLQISSVGYKTIKIAIGAIDLETSKPNVIRMETAVFNLDEVVLSPDSQQVRQKKVGYYIGNSRKIGYWRGGTSLGAEMVTKIKVTKRPRQLNEFSFKVLKNLSDSLQLRVNVYRGDTPYPETKISKKNILFMLSKKLGKVTVDLTPYEIYLDDHFSIGLELLEVYGNQIDLTLAATDDPGTSYRRYASQDQWYRYRNDAMAFTVNTTVFDKDDLIPGIGEDELIGALKNNIVANQISGLVFNQGNPMVNVDVKIEGKNIATTTDENGRYAIDASLGDVVTFDFLNMETVSRTVLETTFGINVSMQVKLTELENVTVTKKKKIRKTQKELFLEYNSNPNLIKTGFGILDKMTSAQTLYILDESEFKSTAINILEAVSGKFPGIRVADPSDPRKIASPYDPNAVLYGRGGGSLLNPMPMVYEIDGVLNVEVPRHLNMNNVKRIAVLPSLSSSAKYGTLAAGGVVVINTKVGNYSPKENGKPIDQAQLKDNLYEEDAISQQQAKRNWPTYLQKLNAAASFQEAIKTYDSYSKNFSATSYFHIDTYLYFKKNWKKEIDMDSVLTQHTTSFGGDISALKALAYAFEEVGELKRADLVYKKIFKMRPNNAQSYLDLARNYVAMGADDKALRLYERYTYLLNQDFLQANEEGPFAIILTEFDNLTRNTKANKVVEKTDQLQGVENKLATGTRIVLDWNEPKADFEVQFVNPKNRYFSWGNTPALKGESNKELVFSKEYFIDDYLRGDWLVNMNYKGAEINGPMYVKATIFFDYGLPSQRTKVRVFRLHLKNVNQQLFTLSGNPINLAR